MGKSCRKKDCKRCQEKCSKRTKKFDSWSEESSSCEKPKCYERKVIVKQVMCEQDLRQRKRHGYKIKEEESWKSISCGDVSKR